MTSWLTSWSKNGHCKIVEIEAIEVNLRSFWDFHIISSVTSKTSLTSMTFLFNFIMNFILPHISKLTSSWPNSRFDVKCQNCKMTSLTSDLNFFKLTMISLWPLISKLTSKFKTQVDFSSRTSKFQNDLNTSKIPQNSKMTSR